MKSTINRKSTIKRFPAALAFAGLVTGAASGQTLLNFSTPGVLETDANGTSYLGDVWRVNGVAAGIDALIEFTGVSGLSGGSTTFAGIAGGVTDAASSPGIIQEPINLELNAAVANNPYVTFRVMLVADDTLTPTTINDTVNIIVYDIDSHDSGSAAARNMTDIFGFKSTETPDLGVYVSGATDLELGGWNAAGASGFTTLRMKKDAAGASDTWSDEGNADIAVLAEQQNVAVRLSYSSFSSAEYVWGFTGESNVRQRELFFNGQDPAGLSGLTSSLITAIPEPSSIALIGLGVFGFLLRRKRD